MVFSKEGQRLDQKETRTLLIVSYEDDLLKGLLVAVNDGEVITNVHLGRLIYDEVLYGRR